jgi:hypothetical protein
MVKKKTKAEVRPSGAEQIVDLVAGNGNGLPVPLAEVSEPKQDFLSLAPIGRVK